MKLRNGENYSALGMAPFASLKDHSVIDIQEEQDIEPMNTSVTDPVTEVQEEQADLEHIKLMYTVNSILDSDNYTQDHPRGGWKRARAYLKIFHMSP